MVSSPDSDAASAGAAMESIFTNHCSETSGSMISPPRCDRGTRVLYGSVLIANPVSSMSFHNVSLHTNRSRFSYVPHRLFIVPSLFMMLIVGSPTRLPMS
jgi:hypothetical protein